MQDDSDRQQHPCPKLQKVGSVVETDGGLQGRSGRKGRDGILAICVLKLVCGTQMNISKSRSMCLCVFTCLCLCVCVCACQCMHVYFVCLFVFVC